jgi:hypothetical protein
MHPFTMLPCMGVALASDRNSDTPLRNISGYECHAILARRKADMDKKYIHSFLGELVYFLNHHKFTQARGLEKTRNFIAYREHVRPNQTPDMKDKAKLGDVVKLSDAINFLYNINDQVFDQHAYRKHHSLIRLYFSPPYNRDLADAFGFPEGLPDEKPLPFSA